MITKYRFPIVSDKDKELPLVLITSGLMNAQPTVNRPDGIAHHQLLFTVNGSGHAKTVNKKYTLPPASVYYLAPNSAQCYQPVNTPWTTIYITYHQNQFMDYFNFENGVYSLSEFETFKDLLTQIMKLPNNIDFAQNSSILLYSLLLKFKSEISSSSLNPGRFQKAHNYILNHFREPIELSYLATLSNVSSEHFCRAFKSIYHFTPFEYIINLRIQEAKKMLVYTDSNIGKISRSVGYNSQSHFIQEFKKYEKLTPLEFRKLHQSSDLNA